MKRYMFFLLCSFLLCPKMVNATIAVMDMDSNRLLYGVNENTPKLVASTSKIMTALVVINNANLNDEITVTEDVLKSFGSGIYIEVGEIMTVKDMLYGLLLRSGNDAAIMLALHVGGSMDGFVSLMNEMALSLGMFHTRFINSSGLENEEGVGNTSTAYDMALLMSYAMKNETFREITSTKHYMVKTNYKSYDWYNKNKLLSTYKYTTGGKTGYTQKAYRTLVTSATKDNKNLVVVTLDEVDDFNKHINLYEQFFKKYKLVNVLNSKTFLKDENLYIKDDYSMLLTDEEVNKINIEVKYTDDLYDRVGYVAVNLNDNTYYKENIYKLDRVKKENFFTKIWNFIRSLFK